MVSWFVTDDEHQKHYLIQKEKEKLNVYRDPKLPLLRMARLSANVLICLFEDIVQTVDLHLKPETLHFGLDKPKGGKFRKELRSLSGKEAPLPIEDIPWKEEGKRVIKISALAAAIQSAIKPEPFSAAEFAAQMIEGTAKVRFCSGLVPASPSILGNYEHHQENMNKWHFVTVSEAGAWTLKWTNRAGVTWTLSTTSDKDTLMVGRDCPYFNSGHTQVKVIWEGDRVSGLKGPNNELYEKSGPP